MRFLIIYNQIKIIDLGSTEVLDKTKLAKIIEVDEQEFNDYIKENFEDKNQHFKLLKIKKL